MQWFATHGRAWHAGRQGSCLRGRLQARLPLLSMCQDPTIGRSALCMHMWGLSTPLLLACLPPGAVWRLPLPTCCCIQTSHLLVRCLLLLKSMHAESLAPLQDGMLRRLFAVPKTMSTPQTLRVSRLVIHSKQLFFWAGSLLETWVPLLHGGCIIIAPPDDEAAMEELLCEAGVTAVLMEGPEIADLLEVWSSQFLLVACCKSAK